VSAHAFLDFCLATLLVACVIGVGVALIDLFTKDR
jgi:hypothetical protein